MRTRAKVATLQAWSLLDLYKALTSSSGLSSSSTGGGWPGTLHISDSDDAVSEFAQTGSIPYSWTQAMKLIPASELADEDPKEEGRQSSAPTHVVQMGTKETYSLRLPDAEVRTELPNLVHLQRWGIDLPAWKLAGLVLRDETDEVLGLLMAPKDPKTKTLSEMTNPAEVGEGRREKWASQFEGTMRSMLDIGVRWSQVSAEDISIDEDDDILITRFVAMTLQGDGEDAAIETRRMLMETTKNFRQLLGLLGSSCNPSIWAREEDDDEEEDRDFASGDEDSWDVDEPEDSLMEEDLKEDLQVLRGDIKASKWVPNPKLAM